MNMSGASQISLEKEKELAALEAVKYVHDGQIVGLGTGSSAFYAIRAIGKLVRSGCRIRAVATSVRTEELAREAGIPLIDINTIDEIDLTIDGADEFTPDLMLIKGGGGALLREKIVASLTRVQVIITDSTKWVNKLGHFPLPVEVIPFAARYVQNELARLGGTAKLRSKDNGIYHTDQGNYILDVDWGLIDNPRALAEQLNRIEGIACHGLFIDLTTRVLMGKGERVMVFEGGPVK